MNKDKLEAFTAYLNAIPEQEFDQRKMNSPESDLPTCTLGHMPRFLGFKSWYAAEQYAVERGYTDGCGIKSYTALFAGELEMSNVDAARIMLHEATKVEMVALLHDISLTEDVRISIHNAKQLRKEHR